MAVSVKEGPSITTGAPLALFEFRPAGALITPYYNVTRDGRRFNWHAVLPRRSSSQ